MEIKEVSRVSHIIRVPFYKLKELKLLLATDVHFDSVNCVRSLLKKHFDEALKTGAKIILPGDWFDLMQGRYDPRMNYADIRPEYKGENYIDAVIDDSVDFLTPYAKHILLIGLGNHETNIIKRIQTNPTERLVEKLYYVTGHKPIYAGYQGYLLFKFKFGKDNGIITKVLKYNHGQRSNARRSKGTLQIDIDEGRWPDADIVVKGDDHMKWYYPSAVREKIDSRTGLIYKSVQHHIRCGSYNDGIGDGFAGWAVEKGFAETKQGGWWITFNKEGSLGTGKRERVGIKIEEAD